MTSVQGPAVGLISLTLASGCMTVTQGRRLKAQISEIDGRLAALQSADRGHGQQIAELDRTLEQAEKMLLATENDVAARAAKTDVDVAAVQGRLDEIAQKSSQAAQEQLASQRRIDQRLASLERAAGQIAEKVGLDLPDDKEQLWRQAQAFAASGERDKERRCYDAFIERFPQDPRAAEAYLEVGLTYFAEARFARAATTFQRLLSTYPGSPVVPQAMLQLSRAFINLSFCEDARTTLRNLVTQYPNSPAALEAGKQLDNLKHQTAACVS
ncbi:MAG TPA: tetratricopeptide repeat protein [Polyangia bacterium]|nr:tetratricopeptide repeat protein [Polyangia bacterium]